ncbi:hypothetical protein Tco_1008470 [Tanacetum coccineum]
MSSNSDDIQAAGSNTRHPMLDRTDYESWSQRIWLYCRGKENGFDKCTDKSKITRKPSKTGKHGHKTQKSTKRSQRIKAEARKVKPQSNPVKEKSIMVNKRWSDRGSECSRMTESESEELCSGKWCSRIRIMHWNCTQPQASIEFWDYFNDKMLLMQPNKNGAVLD